jgi:hypothetical protein
MRRVWTIAVLLVLTACTPLQATLWGNWHQQDPEAARAFLDTPVGRATLDDVDWSSDGPQFAYRQRWDSIAWCESGSQWHHAPVHNRHGSFSGGVMIQSHVWDHYVGERYASDAWLATKEQQIVIAEAILGDVGWHAWQCA